MSRHHYSAHIILPVELEIKQPHRGHSRLPQGRHAEAAVTGNQRLVRGAHGQLEMTREFSRIIHTIIAANISLSISARMQPSNESAGVHSDALPCSLKLHLSGVSLTG